MSVYIGKKKLNLVTGLFEICQQSLVDLREESSTWGMKTTPPNGSSKEY